MEQPKAAYAIYWAPHITWILHTSKLTATPHCSAQYQCCCALFFHTIVHYTTRAPHHFLFPFSKYYNTDCYMALCSIACMICSRGGRTESLLVLWTESGSERFFPLSSQLAWSAHCICCPSTTLYTILYTLHAHTEYNSHFEPRRVLLLYP